MIDKVREKRGGEKGRDRERPELSEKGTVRKTTVEKLTEREREKGGVCARAHMHNKAREGERK